MKKQYYRGKKQYRYKKHKNQNKNIIVNNIENQEVIVNNIQNQDIVDLIEEKEELTKDSEIITESIDNEQEKVFIEVEKKQKYYIGFWKRVALFGISFLIFSLLSLFLIKNGLNFNNKEVINYQESGSIDYKVYLKPNDFYQEEYLNKNMVYIASLIKNIELDIDYEFLISKTSNINLSYEVIGILSIYNESGTNILFEKEYMLRNQVEPISKNVLGKNINKKILIDYDYYNSLANNFKATYGVESNSDLTIYIKIKNIVENYDITENSEMVLTIPLTQKTIDIKLDDRGINKSKNIVSENKLDLFNIIKIIMLIVFITTGIICLIKLINLLRLLKTTKSKYDKYIDKLLNEYDRLIVETPTPLDLTNKKVIKIDRFEELLDVRDNLKKPIIYHNLVKHHKSYFYIENYPICYLYVLKASDVNESKKK